MQDPTRPRPSQSRQNILLLLVAGVFFMEWLDTTIVVTAIPAMAGALKVSPESLALGVSLYALALAVFIPASGWLADCLGARKVFLTAILLFTLASLACGLAASLPQLVAARLIQGVGGAMMMPVGRLLVLQRFEKKDLIAAINMITWPGLIAPVIGPPLGAVIITYLSWPWLFWVNLPLGIAALAIGWNGISETHVRIVRPFDGKGFLLTGGACASLVYTLDRITAGDFSLHGSLMAFLAALALSIFAIRHALRAEHPMLPLDAMADKCFALVIYGGSLFRIAIGAMPFLVPLMLQTLFGLPPLISGFLILMVFAGNVLSKIFVTRIFNKWRFRPVLLCNGLINALAIGACGLFSQNTPVWLLAAVLFLSGVTRSVGMGALNVIGFATLPEAQRPGANILYNVVLQLTLGMSVAFATAALKIGSLFSRGDGLNREAFSLTFGLLAIISLVALWDVALIDKEAGDELRNSARV